MRTLQCLIVTRMTPLHPQLSPCVVACCVLPAADMFPIQTEEQQEGFGGNPFGESATKDGIKKVQGSSKTSRVSCRRSVHFAVRSLDSLFCA